MKRFGLIIAALALVLGMSQCKKPNMPEYTGTGDRIIQNVTLNATYSNDGSKSSLLSLTKELKLKWDAGDKIYVYDGTSLCGTLEIDPSGIGQQSAKFNGTIEPLAGSQLRFYHFNGVPEATVPGFGSNETPLVRDYETQNAKNIEDIIPNFVLVSAATPISGDGSYSVSLGLPFAVVRVKFENMGSGNITVSGMSSTGFSIDKTGALTMNEKSSVTLTEPGTDDFFTVFMPKTNTEYTFTSATASAKTANPWTLDPNYYYSKKDAEGNPTGNAVIISPDRLHGVFTVGPNPGDKVIFSRGNVQYQASTQTWRFAENQYDAIRGGNKNISSSWDGWIDLFGWGTTGYKDRRYKNYAKWYETNFYPYSTPKNEATGAAANRNLYGYGPDYYDATVFGLTLNDSSDWGIHFNTQTENENNTGWRTLSRDEWVYLLETRGSEPDYYRLAKVKINDVRGLLVFPDNFTWTEDMGVAPVDNLNKGGADFDKYSYDLTQFGKIQEAGVVFLPITGNRSVKTMYNTTDFGYYWSSTQVNGENAFILRFAQGDAENYNPQRQNPRFGGYGVRLVRNVQ